MTGPQLDYALAALVFALALCAAAGLGLARWERWRSREARVEGTWLELGLACVALGWGWWQAVAIMAVRNPRWLPICSDMQEYLAYTTRFMDPGLGALSAYRYPLQPALAAAWAQLSGASAAIATQEVALAAAALLPLALYALGRVLAPGPVALAGALLVTASPVWIEQLGRPSDYMLAALLQVLALAAVSWALHRGGPWRQLLAGLALAALMACTPKALTLLLLALPLLLGMILVRELSSPARVGLQLLALLAPLALVWWLYSTISWELRSLEHATIRVLEYAWHEVGSHVSRISFDSVGRSDGPEGYWVVGQAEALWNLPKTVGFLLEVPRHAPQAFEGRSYLAEALRSGLGLGSLAWLALVPVALLGSGPGRPRGWRAWVAWGAAAALLGLALYATARSLTLIRPHPRYLIGLAVLLPPLVPVGAAALVRCIPSLRDLRLLWLPVPLLALVLLLSGGGPVGAGARALAAEQVGSKDPGSLRALGGVAELVELVQPGDQVVDFTPGGLAVAGLLQLPVELAWRPLGDPGGIAPVDPHSGGRRFVVDPCETVQRDHYRAHWGPHAGLFQRDARFHRRAHCVYEDMQPERGLSFGEGPT